MSQLLDNTKKMTTNREQKKSKKLIFRSELSEDFWIFDTKKWQKMTKNREKKSRKINKNKVTKGEFRFVSYNNSRCNFIASHTQWLMGFLTFGCMSNNVTHMCVAYSSELYIIWYLSWVYIISYYFNVRSMSCWICFEYLLIFIFNRSWIIHPIGML